MKRTFHATSHLGKMNCDRFMVAPELSIRELLEVALKSAVGIQRNGFDYDDGDMWARGWEKQKEAEEQLTILDAIDYKFIRPVPGQG